jgi:antitoxin component YwqK of YwqJK toxin-antitoxin module
MRILLLVLGLSACGEDPLVDCPAGASVSGTPTEGLTCVDGEGEKVGPHRRDRPDGTPRERGQYDEAGHRTGTWLRFHPSGQKAREESWSRGFMHGPWAEWDAQGRKTLSGAFEQGGKHGKWWDWGPDGRPLELTTWSEGQMSGPAVAWFDDGDLKEAGHHELGVPVGLWVALHDSGGVASTTPWRDGTKHGLEQVRTPGGRLLRETRFEGGRIAAEQTWHLSGALERERSADGSDEIHDRDGARLKWCRPEPVGVRCEEWYADGTPRARYRLVQQRKHGAYATWHPEGTPAATGSYDAGRREGPWEFRAEDGALDAERSGVYARGARAGALPGG